MTGATTSPPGSGRDAPRPLLIAHRGASLEAPENTIAAFELAVALGADAVQLGVHLSRDGQPVVIHDFDLERTTDGTGRTGDRTVRELKRLDAGGWRDPRFRGQRIQTLQEVLERFRGRLAFWIEIRAGSDLYPDIEDRVVSLLEIYDVLDRAVIQSFDHAALARIVPMERGVRVAGLVDDDRLEAAAAIRAGWHALCPRLDLVTAHAARRLADAGVPWYAWTVNEPAHLDHLVEMGASGVITDHPALLRAHLGGAPGQIWSGPVTRPGSPPGDPRRGAG